LPASVNTKDSNEETRTRQKETKKERRKEGKKERKKEKILQERHPDRWKFEREYEWQVPHTERTADSQRQSTDGSIRR
jgi:hypothetical protein